MEYKQTSITVDKSFMEQQAFRDFLKLPSEEPSPKIELHNLLEVAKVVVRNELISCGSEKELIGLRLECQVSKNENQESAETYTFEWSQLRQDKGVAENKEGISEEQPEVNSDKNPVSLEFAGNLTERLDEVLMEYTPLAALESHPIKTTTRMSFSSGAIMNFVLECSNDCIKQGIRYKKNLITGRCTDIKCGNPITEQPIAI